MKKAICFVFDTNYLNQGKHAILSAKLHNPDHTTILLVDDPNINLTDITLTPETLGLSRDNWLLIGRIKIVEYVLQELNFDTAIFIDADTYTYNNYNDLQDTVNDHSLVVIPHITKPLPNDNRFPQNRIISLSGNYNTGVWAASKTGLDFIKWWKEQTTLFPISKPEAGLVNEQGWLRFAADFDDNVKVFRHPGYNVAYWNIKQRDIIIQNSELYIDQKPLAVIHFSGLKKEISPAQMSVFQNRYILNTDDIVYKLYNDYYNLIWN